MYCVVPWLSTVRLVPVHPIDLFRYIHMSVGACLLDSETVAGMARCTTPSYAYLMCIVRTGTGTDPLGMCTGTNPTGNAYQYRCRPMKCVSVVAR
jgi:hypothetical protein